MMTFFRNRINLYFGILLSCFLCMTGCSPKTPSSYSQTGFYFNTIITITLYDAPDKDTAESLLNHCMYLADNYEKLFSRTKQGSDIWNINHSNGSSVTVSDETIILLKKALYYANLSDGLVDPTIGSLSVLWNFGDNNTQTIPSDEAIAKALSHVNYQNLHINDSQVALLDSGACIDLGFIAKGYIADRMKEYLLSEGINSAIINLGGNVLTIGQKPDGSPFHIGIQEPFSQTGTSLLSVPVTDISLVSSGNYERYFKKEGILYHHILSTKTGYPVNSDLSQVTILSPNSVDGDALSTLCFIMGYEKGKTFIESLEDTEAIFVTQDGKIYKTYE